MTQKRRLTRERNANEIATIALVLLHAELGEIVDAVAAQFVRQVLESISFAVEDSGVGMPTNIWAHWGTGKPQIVIVSEMDALPGGGLPRAQLASRRDADEHDGPQGMVSAAKVLAGAMLDFLTKPELVRQARVEFEKATTEMKYGYCRLTPSRRSTSIRRPWTGIGPR
jgi:hypothetical protein